MAESSWFRRLFDRADAAFDQDRQRNVTLEAILTQLEANPPALPMADLIYKLIRDPDNADTPDMNVDASGADRTFRVTCPVGQRWAVERINWATADNAKDVPNGFFSLTELGSGNGCLIRAHDTDGTLILDFLDGGEIRRTTQYELLAGIDADSDSTANISRAGVRWTIGKAGAMGILEAEQYIEFTLRANLAGLEFFQAMLQGKRI